MVDGRRHRTSRSPSKSSDKSREPSRRNSSDSAKAKPVLSTDEGKRFGLHLIGYSALRCT